MTRPETTPLEHPAGHKYEFHRIRSVIVATTLAYIRSRGAAGVDPTVFDNDSLLFSSLDLDSLDVMMLAEEISSALEIDMELTALIDFPTVGALARHISRPMLSVGNAEGATAMGTASASFVTEPVLDHLRRGKPAVFVVGANHVLPGGRSPFGADCVSAIPLQRWDVDKVGGVRFGSFMEGLDAFDGSSWGLPAGECELMDPQQRLLLELSAELVLDASRMNSHPSQRALTSSCDITRCGVFVGASSSEYFGLVELQGLAGQRMSPYAVTAGGIGVIPGRIAYHLGMQGPALATDTACSSSLVSLGVAVGMMELGILSTSLTCGSNIMLNSRGFELFQAANMLAPDGRCKAMDAAGDGFSRGEAVTSFLLDTEAPEAGMSGVLGAICSVSINQDGRSSRLTAPNGPAQSALIADALRVANTSPADVARLFLHGTGTPLGDPIEVGAALRVYFATSAAPKVLGLSAVKTAMGHSEAAAGTVSLAGAIDMGASRAILPTLHLRHMNENVVRIWERDAVCASRMPGGEQGASRCGTQPARRMVGVSSFASQGTNCHILVSQAVDDDMPIHTTHDGPSSRPAALPWVRQRAWILPRASPRLLLSSLTSSCMSFVIGCAPGVGNPMGNPDGFFHSLIEAARCCLALLLPDGTQASLIGLKMPNIAGDIDRATKDWCVSLGGGAIQMSADGSSSSSPMARAAIALVQQTPGCGIAAKPDVETSRVLSGDHRKHLESRSPAIATMEGTPNASGIGFTVALARCPGFLSSGRIRSIDTIHLPSIEENRNRTHEDAPFVVSYPAGRYCTPAVELTGILFEPNGDHDQQMDVHSYTSMEYTHMSAADAPVERHQAVTLPPGVSVDGWVVRCRPCQTTSMVTSVVTALSVLQQVVGISKRVLKSASMPDKTVRPPRVALTAVDASLGVAACRSTPPAAFARSMHCVAHSVSRELPDDVAYSGDMTLVGNIWTISLLERRTTADADHLRSLLTASEPVIIRGGTGGLGTALCGLFYAHRIPLIVSSRTGLVQTAGAWAAITTAAKSPAPIVIRRAISGSREDLKQSQEHMRLNVRDHRLVHASGILLDAGVRNQTVSMARDMFAAKPAAAELEFGTCFELGAPLLAAYAFSSVAALLHPAGSSTYGAVNAVMESITAAAMSKGVEALSIQWGAWASIGMVSSSERVKHAMRSLGVAMIRPLHGIAAFSSIVAQRQNSRPLIACVPFMETSTMDKQSYPLSERKMTHTMLGPTVTMPASISEVRVAVRRVLAGVLRLPIDSMTESLLHYGADSLCAIDIQQALSKEFGIALPSTVLYDYPTAEALAVAIHAEAEASETVSTVSSASSVIKVDGVHPVGNCTRIGTIGINSMAIRSPAAAHLTIDCTTVAAYERWDVEALAAEAPRARFGKFLQGGDLFDAELFKISAHEAANMDPQQRILLEDSFAVASSTIGESQDVGVIVGMSFWDYSIVSESMNSDVASSSPAMKLTGRNLSVASGRISFVHGYRGPSMTIDTACSSSLVAIHVASAALRHDAPAPSEVMVGCAMMSLAPDVMRSLSMASMISDEGRSRTLDQEANGYGRGEGTAILVMSRVIYNDDNAKRPMLGIVTSSAVNQDGRSASLTAPNGPSQLDLLREAVSRANILPLDVTLQELHGTGTPLGDPIEMAAVARAQRREKAAPETSPMALSATKTIFGHTEPVSGCIGVHSVLKQMLGAMRHPLLHLRSLSPLVEAVLGGGAASRTIAPSRSVAPLPCFTRKYASISAFAFQGTNAHVVVESGSSRAVPGFKRPLPARATYRGQKHWFVGNVHSWIHPILDTRLRGGRRASGDAVTWLAKPRGLAMHAMLQHQVLGKLILPGMAIFRIMSDSGALSVAPSSAWTSPALALCEPTINAPVMLSEQGCGDLSVRVSTASGRVVVSNKTAGVEAETAAGVLAAISVAPKAGTGAVAKRFESESACGIQSTMISGNHFFDLVDTASMDQDHERRPDETVTEPSIEMLDAATHLAAYRETCNGLDVSIPVSSDAMDITWKRTISMRHRTPNVSVSCGNESAAGAGPSWRTRSYKIRAPSYGERRIRSLNSKTVSNSIRRRRVEQVVEQEQAGFPDIRSVDTRAVGHTATGSIRARRSSCSDTRGSNSAHGSLRKSLAFHECVRALDGRTQSIRGPNGYDPLLEGQLRVASNELGFSLPSKPSVMVPLLPSRESFHLPGTCRSSATFVARVVVGGTSGIGQALAGWLATRSHGADPLILVGRRGVLQPSHSMPSSIHNSCRVSSLDCSVRARAAQLAEMCERAATPSCGVLHTAGIVMDEGFLQSSSKSWRNVFAPKYDAFKSVSSCLSRLAVQDILSTSSASIDIGNRGQANYVTANLAMEGEAKALLRAGIPSRIIRYGPWKGLGMLSGMHWHRTAARLGRMGLALMTPLEGIIATSAFLRTPHDRCTLSTIGIIDWDAVGAVGHRPDGTAAATNGIRGLRPDHRDPGGGTSSGDSPAIDVKSITRIIREVAGDDADFFGLDSLSSMDVRNRLGIALGVPLPPTLLFDYPTVDKLIDHLVQRFSVGRAMGAPSATVAAGMHTPWQKNDRRAVHVTRLSQMIPSTPLITFEAATDVFRAKRNLQRPVPLDRWDNDSRFSVTGGAQSIYTSFATFVDFLWAFDAELFGMKPHDAQHTDPQARCLLSITLAALADSGCGVSSQGEGGVFVGSMFYDYLRLFEVPNQGLDPSAVLGNGSPYLSGRLAYAFDLVGPCVGIDTACSSSLVAVHGGRSEIDNGSITYAVACGSNAIILPHTSALICQLGALSRTGRCLSLDATADGYGRGEAFVACVLSLYADQDTLAILSGTAVNQDGRSISLTAPNGPSQERLIRSCLSMSGLVPGDVHSVSIHGTGTLLGDPIETQALSNVFSAPDGPRRGPPVTITANKSLLGHCEGAAGTTGLLNALFNASKDQSNAIHPLRETNPYLVLTGLVPRRNDGPVLAGFRFAPHSSGTSSFGMSGTNAHGVVTRYESANAVKDVGSRPGHRQPQLGRPASGHRLYRQPGLAGRCAFVPVSKQKWLQFHARYTQSQASALFDHRVRLGMDGFRPILAATAQIDLAACVARGLVSSYDPEILRDVSFLKPSVFLGGHHETLIDIHVVQGTFDMRDGHATGPAAAHASGAIVRVARVPGRDLLINAGNCDGDTRCGLRVGPALPDVANRNTASVRAAIPGAPSSMMDAALHLSVISDIHYVQKVPVSCGAIFVDDSTLFATDTWATDHRLGGAGAGNASQATSWRPPFCAIGLVSRPIRHLPSRNMSTIWTGTVLDRTERDYSAPARPSPGAPSRTDIAACLRSIQLLQERRAGDLRSIDLPIVVAQALHRVHANEATTGSHQQDGLFLAPTGAPTRTSDHYGTPFSDVLLTSLGGIGSLVASYFAESASAVRACCRRPATRRRFEALLEAQHARGARSPTAVLTVSNFDMGHLEDAHLFMAASVGITIHHTAGTLRDALIGNVTSFDVTTTVAPKLGVLHNIRSCLRHSAMDSVFAYSSISSIFGTRGQATYAMANAAMDAQVQATWIQGLPYFALQWGLWEQRDAGMAASLDSAATKRLEASGFLRLSPVEGLAHLERYLVWDLQDSPTAIVSKMLDKSHVFGHRRKTASALKPARAVGDGSIVPHRPTKRVDIGDALRRVFYQTASQAVDESVPVLQQGLDSISSIEFTQSLERALGVKLPLTFVYDYPLPEDMIAFIQAEIGGGDGGGGSVAGTGLAIWDKTQVTPPEPKRKTVAVVSHATKYPSPSSPHGATARHKLFQIDGAGVLRRSPFHSLDAFASAFESRELHAFDAGVFRLGRGVALALDPNIRWLLELQLELLSAGRWQHQRQSQSRTEDVGVFLGWMWGNEHKPLIDVSPNTVTGTSAPFAVGYVAYQMQMCGPCVPVDTACSSSLVALHLAKASVEYGECTAATVNGINAFLSLDTWLKIKSISANSPDGRCKTLDAAADGYGRGEGFVTMLIQGSFDHDDVLAFVSGSACSTAGRRSALTAPNGPSQMAVVQDALERARRPYLDSVALHGTGTALGDPIEIRSLLTSLPMSGSFRLGSPKSAVGHTEGSAGLSNALSAIFSASQRRTDAIHNLRALNPLLDGDISGYVARQAGPALSDARGDAWHVTGCSSFGMSGVNSHAILRCATEDAKIRPIRAPHVFIRNVLAMPSPDHNILIPAAFAAGNRPNQGRHLVMWQLIPSMDEARISWLSDHLVKGSPILPGTFFLAISAMCNADDAAAAVLCHSLWTNTMHVRDVMGLSVLTSEEGMITCGLASGKAVFTTSVARMATSATSSPPSHGLTTRPWSPAHARRGSRDVIPNWTLHAASSARSTPTTPIIAAIGPTGVLTGDWRLPAVPRADAALHLTATATVGSGNLYVPATLEAYLQDQTDQGHLTAALGDFASSTWPAIDDNRCTVGASANGDMKLVGLGAALFGAYGSKQADKSSTVVADTTGSIGSDEADVGLSYTLEATADFPILPGPVICPISRCQDTQNGLKAIEGLSLAPSGMGLSVEATSFPAHVAALQSVRPVQGRVDLLGSYSDATRILLEIHQKETGGKTFLALPDARGACGASFRRAMVPAPEFHGDRFPLRLTSDELVQGSDMVQVKVQSVALNFRDFLVAMGLYPTAVDPASTGSDFSGTIVGVGRIRNRTYRVGDAVFGQSKGVFKDRICLNPDLLAPTPVGVISSEEAATLPTVFLTALSCMKCVDIRENNDIRDYGGKRSILIHATSGGLGLALAQVARASGLAVYATAGSPYKRTYVRTRGIDTACDSRDLKFVEDIASLNGVGAVVNTLTSTGYISAGQSILSVGGQFVEVSKRDIFSHARILQDRPDIRYHIVAVDMMPTGALADDMAEIAAMLIRGDITPIPSARYSLSQLSQAMNRFKSSRAIGKTVCSRAADGMLGHDRRAKWLVTGGAGALGGLSCSMLVRNGKPDLVLPLRRMPNIPSLENGELAMSILCASAAMVQLVLADVADRSDFALLETMRFHGMIHSSGALRDGWILGIRKLRPSKEVLAAKAAPMLGHLRGGSGTFLSSVELVVSFSSISSVIPNPGQGNYSWANCLLDGAAEADLRRGRRHVVVNWGPWAGGGMAAHLDEGSLNGIRMLSPAIGAQIIEEILLSASLSGQIVCVALSGPRRAQLLGETGNESDLTGAAANTASRHTPSAVPRAWDRSSVTSTVEDLVAGLLDEAQRELLTAGTPLMQAGLDSLGSIELVAELRKTFNVPFPPTLLFDFPTIDSMVEHVVSVVSDGAVGQTKGDAADFVGTPQAQRRRTLSPAFNRRSIRVLDWIAALPTVRTVPFDRWDRDRSSGMVPPRFGGFVTTDCIDVFDHGAFSISSKESAIMDPQHRVLMMQVMAVRGEHVPQTSVAVGIGRLEDPWHVTIATDSLIRERNGLVSTSRAASASAGRLSYHFDFRGGCLAIDTACSSSLVALHVLFESLTSHNESLHHGFLCGVNMPMSERTSAMLGASAMLASDGRCKALDAAADGYGRSEGSSVLKLCNQTSDNDSDPIIVLGTAVNQDGRSAALTAPNGPAQEAVIRAAGAGAGLPVLLAGMHGTGTSLGDPIEVGSLMGALKGGTGKEHAQDTVTLFASKSELGHAETASGILGLVTNIEMSVSLSYNGLPTLRRLNRHVIGSIGRARGDTSAVAVPRLLGPCALRGTHNGGELASCVSAFAFQGSNASAKVSCAQSFEAPRSQNPTTLVAIPDRVTRLPEGHPLVTHVRFHERLAFQCRVMHPSLHLEDHRVSGKAVFPASGYMELIAAAAEALRIQTGVDRTNAKMPLLANAAYSRPYLMNEERFFLEIAVDTVSGLTTVQEPPHELCAATTTMIADSTRAVQAARTRFKRIDFRPSFGLILVGDPANRTDPPAVVAQTSVRDAHIVHGLDSTWHLCAFFVALEADTSIAPELRIPRTLAAFCRREDPASRSWTEAPAGRQMINVSLSRPAHGLFTASSTPFDAKHLTLDPVSKAPGTVANGWRAASTAPLYAMHPRLVGDPDLSGHPSSISRRASWLSLSSTATIGCLLGALQQGVVPGCSGRNEVLCAGLEAVDRIRESEHAVDPMTLMYRTEFDAVVECHDPGIPICPQTTVLVPGGTGAVGTLVRRFVNRLAPGAHVISLSRSLGYFADDTNQIAKKVEHASFVCSDASQDGIGLLPGTTSSRPAKLLVINATGVLVDQSLGMIDMRSVRSVMAPKYAGTAALVRAVNALPASLLHCGSIAAVLGNEGQASYIMANTILESLSRSLSKQGVASVVLHFGPFTALGTGMASSAVQRTLQRRGVPLLPPVDGLRAIYHALQEGSCGEYCYAYCAFDCPKYFESLPAASSVGSGASDATDGRRRGESDDLGRLQSKGRNAVAKISEIVRRLVEDLHGGRGAAADESHQLPLATNAKFADVGLDSLAAAEFAEALRREFHMPFTATVLFDHPTLADLAEHIDNATGVSLRQSQSSGMHVSDVAIQPFDHSRIRSVAIIATTYRFPGGPGDNGGDTNPLSLWGAGKEIQSLVPPGRWDVDAHYAPNQSQELMYVRVGAWLGGVDMFDPVAFGLSRDEAMAMDPQLRLLLELTHELIRGVPGISDAFNGTSNFVGCMYQEYLDGVLRVGGMADSMPSAITSTGMSFLVGRLSYHYNFRGRAVSCDTACSSSLVGVHLAREALLTSRDSGEQAVAHGVNMMLSERTTSRICMLQALSPVGRCKTADVAADGYGRSESGISMLLGAAAGSDTEGVLAVLLGSGVGHNGSTGGISAPHGPSQTRLIADVWRESGARGTVASLHGTGTSLGDPIEFQALQSIWNRRSEASADDQEDDSIKKILATKAWAGHMEGTAGLVGLVLPLLESTVVAPVCHLRHLNRHIAGQGLDGMFLSRQMAPRSASEIASSSFGMGGTNAHAVARVAAPMNVRREVTLPIFERRRSWPLVPTGTLPTRLNSVATTAVQFEFVTRHAFWMSDHVVGGRALIPGAAMLSLLADAMGIMSTMHMGKSNEHDRQFAVTMAAFLTAADVGPVIGVSLGHGPSEGSRAALSVSRSRICTARCDCIDRFEGRVPRGKPSTSFSSQLGRPAPTSMAFIDARVHAYVASLSPCVTDASMHLGLINSVEARVPVSVGAFARGDNAASAAPVVSCLVGIKSGDDGDDKDDPMHATSQAPHTTLSEVLSKRPRLPAGKPVQAVLRARVEELAPTGPTKSIAVGRLPTPSGSMVVASTILKTSRPDDWHNPLSVASQVIREHGGSTVAVDPSLPMGAAILAVASKEHSLVRAIGQMMDGSPDRSAQEAGHSGEFAELPTATATSAVRRINKLDGCNVVTGAFGGIGTVVAHWLGLQESPVILLGRRVPADALSTNSLAMLVQCDTSSTSDVSHVLRYSSLGTHYVLHHVAGNVRDAMVHHVTPSHVRMTVAGKSGEAISSTSAQFSMVLSGIRASFLYSSITGVTGNRGQLAYAYANGLLNRLAINQTRSGISTISIAWGAWAGKGMARGMELVLASSGVQAMRPVTGLQVLQLLSADKGAPLPSICAPVIVAGTFDNVDLLLGQEVRMDGATAGTAEAAEMATKMAGAIRRPPTLSPQRKPPSTSLDARAIESTVRGIFDEAVGGGLIGDDDSILMQLDSLAAVELVDKLSKGLGVVLAPTMLYDYPSLRLLVDHLLDTLSVEETEVSAVEEASNNPSRVSLDGAQVLTAVPRKLLRKFTLKAGYYCSPSIDELNRMDDHQIRGVSNFVIGREGYGEIRFLSGLDLAEVDLSTEVSIGKRGMMVSAGARPGERLNHPALMCFQAPHMTTVAARRRLRTVLANTLRDAGPKFVFLDEETGYIVLFVEDWW